MLKHILCYGDSNTWGSIPGTRQRHPREIRWTGILQNLLGGDYYVIEEGCNGRTTAWDDPVEGHKNGETYLMPCLWSHRPVDLVILMLGTNDLKMRFNIPAIDIARCVGNLSKIILKSEAGPLDGTPKLLIVCPPKLTLLTEHAEAFAGGTEKSLLLPGYYEKVAKDLKVPFFDANTVVTASNKDGLHWEAEAHAKFAEAMQKIVREIV